MIRTLYIIFGTVLSTFFFGLLAVVTGRFDPGGDRVHRVARLWGRSLLWLSRVPVCVRGLSHIPPGRPVIFMSNHQSNFDIPVLLAHLMVQFRWLAKAELFRIPIFGHGMRAAGYIGIDRSDRRAALESLRTAARTIRDGTSVVIFPEGTRTSDGRIGPFKKGGFVLAVEAGVPVVPVVVRGTWSIMPRNTLRIRPGGVTLDIRPPIDTSAYDRKHKEALMERVRSAMLEAFDGGGKGPAPC